MSDFRARVVGELDTSKITQQIRDIEKNHRLKLVVDNSNANSIVQQMKNVGTTAGNSFSKSFNDGINKININTGKSAIANMQKTLKSMDFNNSSINAITKNLNEMNLSVSNVTTRLKGNKLNLSVKGTDELGRAVTVVKEFDTETRKISTTSKTFSQSFKDVSSSAKKMVDSLDVAKLDNKMTSWLDKNQRAVKDFGVGIDSLKSRLKSLYSAGELDTQEYKNISNEFELIKQRAIAAGKAGSTFGSTLKKAFESLTKYVGISTVIQTSIKGLREMYQSVYAIDTAMTELKKVTDETNGSYERFLKNASQTAKDIGTTIHDLVDSTADFARLGYSFTDSQELAKVANIYNVVGDDISGIDEATKSIISTMTAFNVTAADSISIVDKYNEIGNRFAISSGGIGQAMERSASSLAAANNTIDQSIALITAANKNLAVYVVIHNLNIFNCWEILIVLYHNMRETII